MDKISKDLFEVYRENHPDWSEEQIWTAVSIAGQASEMLKSGDKDIDLNDSAIIKSLIRAAQHWLANNMPAIFDKVKEYFSNLLDNIGGWVMKGINWVIEHIGDFFS